MKNMTMVNHWLEHQQRERGRSTTTLYSYGRDCTRLLHHLGGEPLGKVTTDQLRGWVHAPLSKGERAGMPPSASTVKRRVAMLRSMFRFLQAEGMVPLNPAERLVAPTVHNEAPKPIDLGLWRTLWASELDDFDRFAFGMALFCGLRRSEVVLLEASHFDGPKLYGYRRKGGKLGNTPWLSCVRFFFEHDPSLFGGDMDSFVRCLGSVRAMRNTGPIVPWKFSAKTTCPTTYESTKVDPQHLNRHLERALGAAGLDPASFTPHQLRHTFCTFMLDHGVPLLAVSRLAGHSNVTITQRYILTAEDPLEALLNSAEDGSHEELQVLHRL